MNNFLKRGGTIDPPVNKLSIIESKCEENENSDAYPAVRKAKRQTPPTLLNINRNFRKQLPPIEDSRPSPTLALSTFYKLSVLQKKVLDTVMRRRSVFFTGAAGKTRWLCMQCFCRINIFFVGTGKSYVVQILRSVIEALGWEGKIAYTAPTGVAACNIRGLTIHSWAGVGKASESIEDLLPIVVRNSGACKRWKDVEILVIDEISMLSAELFDKLDMIGRRVRNNMDPFGGIQVIVCGDFFQLPPIGLGKSVKFCFEAEAWKELFEKDSSDGMIILDKVYRQQDDTTFLNLLNEMREGVISGRNQQILLQKVKEAQELYNQQSHSFAPASKQLPSKKLEIRPTKLFSTNHDVDQFNMTELERLSMSSDGLDDDKDPIIYFARDDGSEPYLSQLKAGTKAPEKLYLKRGAQVMLLKNLDTENGLVNGTRGTVVDFERSSGRTDFCPMLPVVNFLVVVGSIHREERVVLMPEAWEVKLGEKYYYFIHVYILFNQ